MDIVLGPNRYGKAETRVVAVRRHADRHDIADLNVSIALSGDLAGTHLTGDNGNVLPTDSQKNTVYAFAKRYGIAAPEEFGLRLARHFVESQPPIRHARVAIEEYAWQRIPGTTHSFERAGAEVRTAIVNCDGTRAHVVSGLTDLVVLNTTGSEFRGYVTDEYTTLPETGDRILATAVTAAWRHADTRPDPAGTDWTKSWTEARRHLVQAFADTYSRSLQQTLYAMGSRVLAQCPELCEVRLTLPNKHHFAVDLSPFGLANDNEVFFAADRPYGLIEGTVQRDDAPPAGPAWE